MEQKEERKGIKGGGKRAMEGVRENDGRKEET